MNLIDCSPSQDGKTLPVAENGEGLPEVTPPGNNVHRVCRLYRRNRRGASAVEFAIVAPIFILLVFGMIEFGRMCMVQQLLTNASREGARLAVLDGSTEDAVKDVVENYLVNAAVPIDRDDITVTPNPTAAAYGEPVSVTVSVNYSDVSWLPGSFYLGGTTLQASAVMRRESVQ